MKGKVLAYLKENKGYISGQELSDCLNVSRTSIWKVINQLKSEGYQIESVPNKGYCLKFSPDVLSPEEVKIHLKTKNIGHNVIVYDVIDSTNQQAKRLALEGAVHGTVILAEQQSQGKGRRGRSWSSPPKTGIWMSIVLKPNLHPNKASMLTLLAGLATVNAINKYTKNEALIKWPNDIVMNNKKVSGVLTEMSAELDAINYVVVGIGINVNTLSFDEAIAPVATSLAIEEGAKCERIPILQNILELFEAYYEEFVLCGDLSRVLEMYIKKCINISKEVRVIAETDEIMGTAVGITPLGELVIKDQMGNERIICSGEVSVRGLYGYV